MASSTHKKPPRTASELELLDSVSGRDVMEFQNHIRRCKASLMLSNCFSTNGLWNSAPDATLQTTATLIKAEPSSDFLVSLPPDQAKLEPDARNLSPADPIRTQEIEENGRKVIEILSDSETDDNAVDSDVEVMESLLWGSSRSSSLPPVTASDPEDNQSSSGPAVWSILVGGPLVPNPTRPNASCVDRASIGPLILQEFHEFKVRPMSEPEPKFRFRVQCRTTFAERVRTGSNAELDAEVPFATIGTTDFRLIPCRDNAYFICLILDPNVKDRYFRARWSDVQYQKGIKALEETFDEYHARLASSTPQVPVTAPTTEPAPLRRYGSSYLLDAVNSLQQDDWAKADPRDELKGYLSAPVEKTDNVLFWWGVRGSANV
ncbi:hypothetical protein C8R45DRAFT_1192136 [Mycena sanguinolenta]|nr:hypothetical protein C8R45DRAFT_1192136 [Mycena sanguinolenta]